MPGNSINELGRSPERPSLDFTWTPGGGGGDPTYSYPGGANSGAKRAPANTEITFTAATLTSPGTNVVAYAWDFGDGTTGHGPVAKHTFTAVNVHLRVTLCITDNHGDRHCCGHQMMLY